MAIDITTFNLATYKDIIVGKPVPICSTPSHKSKVATINIVWQGYSTSAVRVNFNQGTVNPLDKLIYMYVDNRANSGAVFIYFNDTQYGSEVGSGDAQFLPIMSQSNIMDVYNENRNTALGSSTRILLMNFKLDPFLATATPKAIEMFQGTAFQDSQGNTVQNFVSGILGDTHIDFNFSMVTNGTFPLLNIQPFGFYIVTNLQASVYGVTCTGGPIAGAFGLQDVTAAKSIITFPLNLTTNLDYYPQRILYQQNSEYLLMDATHNISYTNNLGVTAGNGAVSGSFAFSFDFMFTPSRT